MTDDELKALVAGIAVAQERTDEQLKALVAGIAAAQDRTDAQMAKTDAQLAKTDAQLAKTDAQLAKTDAQLAKTDAQLAKTDAQLAKTDAKLRRLADKVNHLAEMYGGVGNNQGAVAEEFYFNSLNADPVLGEVRFDFIEKNITRSHAGRVDEFDLLLVNGRAVYVVEVKYKAHENDLRRLLEHKVASFRHLFPEHADREQRFVLAAFHIHDELKSAALAQGVTVLQRKGDLIESIAA